MGFTCGIVGLPNVGKSTLFNALTATQAAESANYPFTTLEPNSGHVPVPDSRLDRIAEIAASETKVATRLEFEDIAGLVEGASRGEGLGNQFLAHIREVDAILHVARCFDSGEVSHVSGSVDPLRDIQLIETELALADLQSLERRQETLVKKVRGLDKEAQADLVLVERLLTALAAGETSRSVSRNEEEELRLRSFNLLTEKPVLYVCNVEEDSAAAGNDHSQTVETYAADVKAGVVTISAKFEAEIVQLTDPEERLKFLETLGLAEPGLDKLIRAGYTLLGLVTFFTAGPNEARAWTLPENTRAQDAAGKIHTDFARGFIAAETIDFDEFIAIGGEQAAREAGKLRQEGRDYVIKDGDVILFRFNV